MSSGFVSAGVEGEDYEGSKPNDEWLKVKQELEESRQRRAAEGQQEGGKSLYEVLQQNKGMARIKNAGVFTILFCWTDTISAMPLAPSLFIEYIFAQ